MTKLITARARKNKRTARMLANARKDHSIPLYNGCARDYAKQQLVLIFHLVDWAAGVNFLNWKNYREQWCKVKAIPDNVLHSIGPLHDPVTWYKITYTGEQVAQWDFQNKGRCIVLEVPLCNLLTSICNFVPCDRVVKRAYWYVRASEFRGYLFTRNAPVIEVCEAERNWRGKSS